MQPEDVKNDISQILVTGEQIHERIQVMAAEIDAEYREKNVLLLGVLKGAVMFMADISRAMSIPINMDWMAVSSYGSGTVSSGVVRILKDLDADVLGRHILIVEDIIDSGLTLSWLIQNLEARGAASVEVVALLRKPEAVKEDLRVRWIGFDIPNEFVVGFGLDWNERYRNLTAVGVLKPEVYS